MKHEHPTPPALAAFADDELEPERLEEIWAHLDYCPFCISWVAALVRERRGGERRCLRLFNN